MNLQTDSKISVQSSVPKSPRVALEDGKSQMYGDFCSDTAYLMTPDLAAELVLKSKKVRARSD